MNCKICNSETSSLGQAKVLGKYTASYRYCGKCAFVFVAEPFWLSESYQNPINRTDLGTISRMEVNSLATKSVIELLFRHTCHYLDYGAGYGAFVRRMRDLGYDFGGYDCFCENIFSKDFQLETLVGRQFDLVSAFEVVEHIEKPLQFFDEIFKHTETIFFSTEIISDPPPMPGKWWYYGHDHGQHISFYSLKSLKYLASIHGRHLCTSNVGLHLLSRRRIDPLFFKFVINRRFCKIFDLLWSRRSLLWADVEAVKQRHLKDMEKCITNPVH